jgi:hypothetical protein
VKPDLNPKTGQIAPKLYPRTAALPPGHTLKLGESRRFGDVVVTPLRVTREPLEFVHYQDPSIKPMSPTEPVLKLWLRLENVSGGELTPLGNELVFTRSSDHRANNFVCKTDDPKGASMVLLYPYNVLDNWNLKGAEIGRTLAAGETFETYLPTDTWGLDDLTGNLVWRIHLRKGYNAGSGRGVTTLVDVNFSSSDVQKPKG